MTAAAALVALLVGTALPCAGQSPELARYASDLRAADALLAQGDFKGVIERLGHWPDAMPDRPEARHFLGLAHYRLRNFGESVRHLAAALEREQEGSAAWKQSVEILGVAHYFEGRWQDAVALLETASRWKPGDSELLYTLAMTYVHLGRGSEARIPFAKIFQVDPASPQAYALAAELMLQENRLGDAAALLASGLELQPDLPGADYRLGAIALRQGAYAKALALLRRALERDPKHALAWQATGEALLALGRVADSVQALKRAVWLDTRSTEAYLLLARIYMDQGALELAQDTVRRTIGIAPHSYEAHYLQSRIHYKTGRADLARKHLAVAQRARQAAAQPVP